MTRISATKASVWLLVAVLAALPAPLFAQSQSAGGAIEGTVTDESGGVLPGATVTVRNRPPASCARPRPTPRASSARRCCRSAPTR